MRRILHRSEKELIRVLFNQTRLVSIHEIADLAGMSWLTAKKYLDLCNRKKIVKKQGKRYKLHEGLIKALFENEN